MVEKGVEGAVRLLGWSVTSFRLLELSQQPGKLNVVRVDGEFVELGRRIWRRFRVGLPAVWQELVAQAQENEACSLLSGRHEDVVDNRAVRTNTIHSFSWVASFKLQRE